MTPNIFLYLLYSTQLILFIIFDPYSCGRRVHLVVKRFIVLHKIMVLHIFRFLF